MILVLNCGSSSIKFALYPAAVAALPRQPSWAGRVQGIGGPAPELRATGQGAEPVTLDATHPTTAALGLILARVETHLEGRPLAAVAHRVVHGGGQYFAPVRVTQRVIDDLRRLIPLAPLHQPFPLKAMAILMDRQPRLPQIACFDTAFHRSLPMVEQLLPLPWSAWQNGLRRYGFHGLSYEYMSHALPERHGALADGRVIVAHLGSGASLCAMKGRESIATTMGFSALDGLMMGTRTGALDPGALLYLMEVEGLSLDEVGQMLYRQSGLLGVSGLSDEPRVVVQHEDDPGEAGQRARLALTLYVRRIVAEVGALMTALQGLDLLVFTAGVGENCAFIRSRVCAGLAFLGVALDRVANDANAAVISTPGSPIRVAVEPTNEEWITARHAQDLLA
ncbi:acetate kinase [Paracoccus halophilus]|uniref:Acetate kinase n=1 Tax=Paracoccus halophilus TaxID=376733 RepID=A0A099EXH9_9RHOB|nr:acetate/propionate family kinase [Paracoccus halophilus]KGJ02678.1 acetate kinase [Paracoccus halophilus]SFA60692.1 acetate kinase [Paracoccus halophilus]